MTLKITYSESFPRWALEELGASSENIDYVQKYIDRVLKFAVGSFEWDVTREVVVKIQKGATFRMRTGRLNGVYGTHKIPCKTVTHAIHRSGHNPADIAKTGGKTTIVLNIGKMFYQHVVRAMESGLSEKVAMNFFRGGLAETVFHEMTHAHQCDRGSLTHTMKNRKWYHHWEGGAGVFVSNLSWESYRDLPWEVEARSKGKSIMSGFSRHIKIHKAKSLTFNELQDILK